MMMNANGEMPEPVDCRSEEGITVGLIDTIVTAAHALKGRTLNHPAIIEALKDLADDGELRMLLIEAVGFSYDKVKRCYETDALERAMQPSTKPFLG